VRHFLNKEKETTKNYCGILDIRGGIEEWNPFRVPSSLGAIPTQGRPQGGQPWAIEDFPFGEAGFIWNLSAAGGLEFGIYSAGVGTPGPTRME
jgi:hypothetical protein